MPDNTIFLDRIDAAPILGNLFEYPFATWLAVLVNAMNENIQDIQNALNLLQARSYTAAEIAAMFTAGDLENGMMLYDSDNDEYVGVQANALVKFTTTSYP
jgi:hypothetical protein